MEQFKHAIVYGQSVKHQPQRVGLSHELADEDISKCSRNPSARIILTVRSHNNKTMIAVNEIIGLESSESGERVPRFSSVPHCQVSKIKHQSCKMRVAKAGLTFRGFATFNE